MIFPLVASPHPRRRKFHHLRHPLLERVAPREQATAIAYFPWSKVAFTIYVEGRRLPGVPIKLLRNSQVVAELRSGAAPQALSPGKYEVEVQLRGRTVHVDRLRLLEGATQNIPLQF